MTKGRNTRLTGIDGRRCSKCKKLAKDLIDGEYLCRLHSPVREGFKKLQEANKKKWGNKWKT